MAWAWEQGLGMHNCIICRHAQICWCAFQRFMKATIPGTQSKMPKNFLLCESISSWNQGRRSPTLGCNFRVLSRPVNDKSLELFKAKQTRYYSEFNGFRSLLASHYFESILIPLEASFIFWGSWGSSKNWFKLKIEPPLSNSACLKHSVSWLIFLPICHITLLFMHVFHACIYFTIGVKTHRDVMKLHSSHLINVIFTPIIFQNCASKN